jgi:putative FmdB family regulatory protein
MPTYDYQCKGCGHKWELFQPITAKPTRKCPTCGKLKAQRVIGPGAGFLFKGSGFYQTDYRSKSYTDAAKADSAAQSKASESASESKSSSDSKPAPKSSSAAEG